MTREEFRGALSDIDEGGRLSHSEEARKAEILLLDHDKEQRAEIARLREDLKKLVNEIDGLLGIEEEQLRNIVGNTNINVLHVRIARAKDALKETL